MDTVVTYYVHITYVDSGSSWSIHVFPGRLLSLRLELRMDTVVTYYVHITYVDSGSSWSISLNALEY